MSSSGKGHAVAPAAVLLAALILGGCASGVFDSELPQQQTYVIAALPPVTTAAAAEPLAADLAVARPLARPGLDSDRIVVQYPDRRLDAFARSRWGASADLVVQNLLIESLRNSARLRSVQPDLSAFASQYLLQTELKDFQAEYLDHGAAPVVRVTLIGTVGSIADRRTLASFTATASVPAAGNNLRAVVAAFESAYQQAAQTTVEQTLQAVSAALAVPASNPAPAP